MHSGMVLLVYLTVQRLTELYFSRRNEASLLAAGGIEYGRSHFPLMIGFHALWLAGLWALGYGQSLQPLFFGLFVALQVARYWVLGTLGRRWTLRVIVVAGEKLVARGPYRFMKHPNYAVVAGEVAVAPLALGMPIYALVFTIFNAAILMVRIRVENEALRAALPAER